MSWSLPRTEAGFPMAPAQADWDALTSDERAEVVRALPGEVTYEEMSPPEGDRHRNAKSGVLGALRGFFARQKRRVYIGSELPVYYPGAPRFAPDICAVLDVDLHERDKYVVADEGKGLDWVMEVHVGGDRKKDAERNVTRYAEHGIPEYFLFDRARVRLHAYRLAAPDARVYTPVVPQQGMYESTVLGLTARIEGDRLRFYSGTALLLEEPELVERLERLVLEAEQRLGEESRRLEETQRREEDAARTIARLEEEIRRLKG